jgi:hypothetical protein
MSSDTALNRAISLLSDTTLSTLEINLASEYLLRSFQEPKLVGTVFPLACGKYSFLAVVSFLYVFKSCLRGTTSLERRLPLLTCSPLGVRL